MKNKEELKDKKLNPYTSDKLAKIPAWIKILLLKYWVVAAAFFFFGIGNAVVDAQEETSYELFYVFISLGIALFSEYIVKPMVRLMKTSRCDTYKYNVINLKGVLSFFANLVYAFLIMIPMFLLLIELASHGWVLNFLGNGDAGVEPFTAGLVYIVLDFIVLFIKNCTISLYKYMRYKHTESKEKKIIGKINNKSNDKE